MLKPSSVFARINLASTKPLASILDPFAGSATTGIAANLLNRRFVGIETEEEYLRLGKRRKIEIENPQAQKQFREKINGFSSEGELSNILLEESKQN